MLYDNVARVTISIDAKTLRDIQKVAGKRGVSKFFVAAAKKELGWSELDAILDEWDEKYGKPSPAVVRRINRDMNKFFGIKK